MFSAPSCWLSNADLTEVMFAKHIVLLMLFSNAFVRLLSLFICTVSSLGRLLLYDIKICSSLSGSWARVRSQEAERMMRGWRERLCVKVVVEEWWALTEIKGSRERKEVWRKKKNRRRAVSLLNKYVKLNQDANSNMLSCSLWRAAVSSLKCVCHSTVIMVFSPSVRVELYCSSTSHTLV